MLLDDFCVLVPGETTLILVPVQAAAGRLNVVLVWLLACWGRPSRAATSGSRSATLEVAGSRERYGHTCCSQPRGLDKATAFFRRHGGKVVVAPFIEGLRQADGITAGISVMHWATFVDSTRPAARSG
jgi:membrane protein DedA with SNARE-associated domain